MSAPSSERAASRRFTAAFKVALIDEVLRRVKHGEAATDVLKEKNISDASYYLWKKNRRKLEKEARADADASAPTGTDEAAAPAEAAHNGHAAIDANVEAVDGLVTGSFPLDAIPDRHPPPARKTIRKMKDGHAQYLTAQQAAKRIGISYRTLEKYRDLPDKGPPYINIGRRVVYPAAELDAWLKARPLMNGGLPVVAAPARAAPAPITAESITPELVANPMTMRIAVKAGSHITVGVGMYAFVIDATH